MSQTDNKRVAIVTGAFRGIGAEFARRLAKEGFAVAITYASSAKEAEALAAELGTESIAVKADVANPDDVKCMFETVEARLGRVAVLINNAGVLKTMSLADTSDALFNQTFDINVRGTTRCAKQRRA